MAKDGEKIGCGYRLISIFGLFSLILVVGIIASTFWDGIRYEYAVECEANKPEITNCYETIDATVLEITKKPGNLRTPNVEMFVETNDGRKLSGKWLSKNIGEPFFENDLLEVEIWKGKVITAKKAGEYYRLSDNPKLEFSFFDFIVISAVFVIIVGAIIITVIANLKFK
jgi:hypothetical protein